MRRSLVLMRAAGYPDEGPYDRIIVTASAPDITPAWREQLRTDGRLVLPLEIWRGLQVCTAFEPAGNHLTSVAAQRCGFVSLRGELTEASLEEPEVERSVEPAGRARPPKETWRTAWGILGFRPAPRGTAADKSLLARVGLRPLDRGVVHRKEMVPVGARLAMRGE